MRHRHGFTLVEVIVILTLIAILTAAAAPSMTGYIRRAIEQNVISRASAALQAAQTLLVERYADVVWTGETELTLLLRRGVRREANILPPDELLELAQISPEKVEGIWIGWDAQASVTDFVWMEAAGGGTCAAVWDGDHWEIRRDWMPE